jgi:hypothetical protein
MKHLPHLCAETAAAVWTRVYMHSLCRLYTRKYTQYFHLLIHHVHRHLHSAAQERNCQHTCIVQIALVSIENKVS